MTRVEELCSSRSHLCSLRTHRSSIDWNRRWQLPVYFQLRFKEIAGTLEEALEVSGGLGKRDLKLMGNQLTDGPKVGIHAPQATGDFQLSATAAVFRGLSTCWSSEVFLPELTHRFWRLSLQVGVP